MDRNRQMATRTSDLGDNVTQVVRTSNYHYAHMRCAEDTANRLSVRHPTLNVLGGLNGVTRGDLADVAAVRDSYYLLAAAHRSAAHRMERRVRRQLAWLDFKAHPVREVFWRAGDVVRLVQRKAYRLARTVRRVVTV